MAKTHLEKLMFSINLLDRVTGPAGRIQKSISGVAKTATAAFSKITAGGAGVAASAYALNSLSAPAREFNLAVGEVRSLDVARESLNLLSNEAIKFSIKFGGSAQAYVKSAYEIQSAMEGITGKELSSFTYSSNVLAKATLSNSEIITNYMGTMYNTFEKSAAKMGKSKWVERLTGQTATAVQMFKTTGSKMAESFSTLGSSAASMGVSMSEQMAVLGTLQATMSGSEAATKYTAFISGAVGAQKKLGLSFFDSAGKMKALPKILDTIKGKIGHLSTDRQFAILQKSFGSIEAVKLIQQLLPKTDSLGASIQKLGNIKGMEKAMAMAKTMVDPFQQLTQGVKAVRIGLGQALLPVLNPVVSRLAEGAGAIYNWTKEFPGLSRWIGYGIVGVAGLTGTVAALGAMVGFTSMATMVFSKETKLAGLMTRFFGKETIFGKIALAGWNFVMKATTFGLTVLRGALLAARTGFLWLTGAMLSGPGLIITAVVGLTAGVATVIYKWDSLKTRFRDVGWIQSLMGWFEKAGLRIKAFGSWLWDVGKTALKVAGMVFLFGTPLGWMVTAVGTVIHNWEGLKAAFMDSAWGKTVMGWVGKITGGFKAVGGWLSGMAGVWSMTIAGWTESAAGIFMSFGSRLAGIVGSWGQTVLGWMDTLGGGLKTLGTWLVDVGGTALKVVGRFLLFTTPVGWMIQGIRAVVANWEGLKASFMDSSWGKAVMGWIDKILGAVNKLPAAMTWLKDKLSWIPGIGGKGPGNIKPMAGVNAVEKYTKVREKVAVPSTTPSLEAPRRSAVAPGGVSKSITQAFTNSSTHNDSTSVTIGQVVTNRSLTPQDLSSMACMGA